MEDSCLNKIGASCGFSGAVSVSEGEFIKEARREGGLRTRPDSLSPLSLAVIFPPQRNGLREGNGSKCDARERNEKERGENECRGKPRKTKKVRPYGLTLKRRLPTLPHDKCSTIGVSELNFSVRNGKRWNLTTITT